VPFGKLLKKLTKDKKLTYKELSNICNKNQGKDFITDGYIKEIANNRKNPPTEEKIKALAKALQTNEEILLLEAYLDKAPEIIKRLLNNIRDYAFLFTSISLENEFKKTDLDKCFEKLNSQPFADYFADYLKLDNIEFKNNKNFKLSSNGLDFQYNLNDISFIKFPDDSMEPQIFEGDSITLERKEGYTNGDILAINIQGYNDILYRFIQFNGKTVTLTPLNTKKYHSIAYNREDINIIGKVSKVMREL